LSPAALRTFGVESFAVVAFSLMLVFYLLATAR
jgi:hypothetical protein